MAVARFEKWSRVDTPEEIKTWRSLVEGDLDEHDAFQETLLANQKRNGQLLGGALVALILNLVLLLVNVGVVK